ncbi:hypothetical protein K440DRAFT_628465 [Wilcoxina mikolae CBS 423.85]|nr:hypothetical protein K440DRAFT_628465 [Wilcoxina mikolae CBS 423.85]
MMARLENNDKPALGLRNKVRGLFSSRHPPAPLNISRPSTAQPSRKPKPSPSPSPSPHSPSSDESFVCVDSLAIQRRQEITGSFERRQRRTKPRSEPRTEGWREWNPELLSYRCMTCGVGSSDVRRKDNGWFCRTCMCPPPSISTAG